MALGLEYDGRGFCGWQSQAGACGVQDALERALATIAGQSVRVVAAGRTDTGVHAVQQVVHFDTAAVRPQSAWVRGTNTTLATGVAVLWAREVSDQFHARFSARSRSYTYLLLNRHSRPGLLAGRVGWFHHRLDDDRMREAARLLIGAHDFSAFRAAECQADTPFRDMREIAIERHGNILVFRFSANAFLHKMVRNIVGSLVYVGKGKHPPRWIGELLAERDRRRAAPTFMPDGLYLTAIGYDDTWQLPTNAGRTPIAALG
jgi:tRNA pseudouridine38-40 synthase